MIILALLSKLLDQSIPLVTVWSIVSLLTEQLWFCACAQLIQPPISTITDLLKVSQFQNVLLVSSFRPKYQRKNLTISALEFWKWSNHKIKALYNVCTTLNSPYKSYSDYSIIRKWLYFVDLPTFQILGQKLSNFFVGVLVETMVPKGHFEINWPLVFRKTLWFFLLLILQQVKSKYVLIYRFFSVKTNF